MQTLAVIPPILRAAPAPDHVGGQQPFVLLIAAVALMIAIVFMWRAVGPVLEILKAALYAVSTFLLIAVAVVLLVVTAVNG
jgi:hypothetical protein